MAPITRRILILSLLVILVAAGGIYATPKAPSKEVVSQLAKGKRLLREGDWLRAAKVFEQLAGQYPSSEYLDQFVFYRAKAKYYFGELSEAAAGFSYFISRFPTSPMRAYAYYFLGNTRYRLGHVDQAVKNYLHAYQLSDDTRLNELTIRALTAAFQNAPSVYLNPDDLALLSKEKRCALVDKVLDILVERGNVAQVEELASSCGSPLPAAARQAGVARRNRIDIALALPFSGEYHSFGEDIYNGAVIAAEQYQAHAPEEIVLTPYDTKGDPIEAARIVGELVRTPSRVVIGPLTSEEAAVVAAKTSCNRLPTLVPAATQSGFTKLSEVVFQLSPNIELQGVTMAKYAREQLHADSAVIITSTKAEHLQMSRAFSDAFTSLGGKVIATEYYRPRDKDFGPYIRDIKAMLLGYHPDSIFFINEQGDTLDPDGIPAHVDCLFLPGDPSQIRLLLPQINFYNLKGAYLGSDGWGDEVILKLGDNITKEGVFPSPFLNPGNSETYLQFATAFDTRYGHRPNRLAALGYDAVNIITTTLAAGGTTREGFVEALRTLKKYRGASGMITFGKNRENIEMPIYKIISEQAIRQTFPPDSAAVPESE